MSGEYRREHHPRHHRDHQTGPWTRRRGAERRGKRAGEHHPFDAEIDHTGPLGDGLAGGRQKERRAHPNRRRQESAHHRLEAGHALLSTARSGSGAPVLP